MTRDRRRLVIAAIASLPCVQAFQPLRGIGPASPTSRRGIAGALSGHRLRAGPHVRPRRAVLPLHMQLDPEGATVAEREIDDELLEITKSEIARKKLQVLEERPVADDVLKPALYVGGLSAVVAALSSVDFVPASLPLVLTFLAGYGAIVFEEFVAVDKSAVALAMGIACWSLVPHATGQEISLVLEEMSKSVSETSQVVFFLVGAMAIVETVDAHKGFGFITDKITTTDKRALVVIVGALSFCLSSILDNLTTTIVICSLLGKLVPESEKETRQLLGGLAVIAANAGGAWSPIGDVTTTMLWMGGEITVMPLIKNVFLPSLACVTGATAWQLATLSGPTNFEAPAVSKGETPRGSSLVAAVGLGGLLFVPAFKAATGLPPFAGMLVSMSALWALTDKLHGADKPHLRMHEALRRIDTAGSLFFLGILLAVGALESSGILTQLAQSLTALVPDDTLIATAIGAVSAVIDNVPLVAAAMGMYDLTAHPVDSQFWDLIAFCAGTGGSMLIIGSAAGIAYMGIEEVSFRWYLQRIAPGAIIGYVAGIAALVVQGGSAL